ncbi:hypothetical protein I4U23_002608 [Adineta vaga]|nr:hypothetical protein I4U23_002608 [Adineta vaga]
MDSDNLTEEQSNALVRFQEFTRIDSYETSRQYLSMHDWDVERAVNTVLMLNTDLPTNNTPPVTTEQPIPPVRSVAVRYMPNYVLRLFRAPLSFLYTFYLKLQPFLPWRFVRDAFSFIRSLFWIQPQRDSLAEIQDYCTYFNTKFGTNHPTFYQGKLSQALRDAQREVRLLFIYIYDKNSVLCDRFSHEIICGEAFRSILHNNLFWSTSRDTQEGIAASRLLMANVFPCFCIIAHHGSQQTVQFKLGQYADSNQCLAEIFGAVENAHQTLEHIRQRRTESISRDRLLEEQNAAYLDSVRIDKEKAEQREREESERQRLEEEEQRKLQKFADFRDQLKQTLSPEPSSTENDTIQVSIRLPTGESIRRRFRRNESAKSLFEFAWTNSNVPNQFELLWGYPRKRYQYEQISNETIGDLMERNTETCFLEQIDEDK